MTGPLAVACPGCLCKPGVECDEFVPASGEEKHGYRKRPPHLGRILAALEAAERERDEVRRYLESQEYARDGALSRARVAENERDALRAKLARAEAYLSDVLPPDAVRIRNALAALADL